MEYADTTPWTLSPTRSADDVKDQEAVELWSAVEPHCREYHDDVNDHVLEEA
jgi:hypothetical protein